MTAVALREVGKAYGGGGGGGGVALAALRDVDLDIELGDFLVITGRSGCGKTTLLNIAAGLATPTSGTVTVDGLDLWSISDAERSGLRNRTMGFVFQFAGLLPTLTAKENAVLPSLFRKGDYDVEKRVTDLFESFGISDKMLSYPSQLSGGEMKRVSIARALSRW